MFSDEGGKDLWTGQDERSESRLRERQGRRSLRSRAGADGP
jgi:hypothetical protein